MGIFKEYTLNKEYWSFRAFPTRLFGDTTIPAYDQLIISNGEDYIDLVTDLSNIVALENFRLRCPHPALWT